MLRNSFGQYGPRPSLVFAGEESCTYSQLEEKINRVIRQLISLGISKGDKIAILSTNMPNWGIAYFAIASAGAVVVPILPDFSAIEINNIIQHSEPKMVFVSENLISKIEQLTADPSKVIIRIETFEKLFNQTEKSH